MQERSYLVHHTEVLAPVPSYEEWKELVDSQKAAKKVVNHKTENRVCKLEQQLAEANEVIRDYVFHEYLTPETYEMRHKLEVYCQKWKIGEKGGV